MKLTREILRQLIIEAIESKEIKMKDIERAVRKCLEKEGGAAGMSLLVKCVKALETKTKKLPKIEPNKKYYPPKFDGENLIPGYFDEN